MVQEVLAGALESVAFEVNCQLPAWTQVEAREEGVVSPAANEARLLIRPLRKEKQPFTITEADRRPDPTPWWGGDPHKHGREWTSNSGPDQLTPAPAVTFSGWGALPCVRTSAPIPLPPGAEPAQAPVITSSAEDTMTVWSLPWADGTLRWRASPLTSEVEWMRCRRGRRRWSATTAPERPANVPSQG